jgi:hypothetical protein
MLQNISKQELHTYIFPSHALSISISLPEISLLMKQHNVMPLARALSGSISEANSHVMGPTPIEKNIL